MGSGTVSQQHRRRSSCFLVKPSYSKGQTLTIRATNGRWHRKNNTDHSRTHNVTASPNIVAKPVHGQQAGEGTTEVIYCPSLIEKAELNSRDPRRIRELGLGHRKDRAEDGLRHVPRNCSPLGAPCSAEQDDLPWPLFKPCILPADFRGE